MINLPTFEQFINESHKTAWRWPRLITLHHSISQNPSYTKLLKNAHINVQAEGQDYLVFVANSVDDIQIAAKLIKLENDKNSYLLDKGSGEIIYDLKRKIDQINLFLS